MQTGKSAAAVAKESVSNIAASAKSGMEKSKAIMQEKVDKMTAHNPTEKEMAKEHKEAKINQAEMQKHQAREHNAAAKEQARVGGTAGHMTGPHTIMGGTGTTGHVTGPHTTMGGTGTGYGTGGSYR